MTLVQEIYDFRFSNIVTIVEGAVEKVVDGLEVVQNAYQKWAKMWNAMNPDDEVDSSVDISSVQSALASYEQSVTDWVNSKLALYSSQAFDDFVDTLDSDISSSILSALSSTSSGTSTSTTSNTSTTTNTTNNSGTSYSITINGATINADSQSELIEQLITIAENKTSVTTSS